MSATTISGLVCAAANLDTDAMTGAVRTSVASYGVCRTWEWLVSPAWHALRAGREDTEAAERLFTRTVTQVLVAVRRPRDRLPAQVLMACAEREHHVLPLEAFASALAEAGTGSCVLGPRVTPPAVEAAVRRLLPAVVVIWSQTGDTGDPRQIRTLLTACPAVEVIAAGPGWGDAALPAITVTAALKLTRARLGPGGEGDGGGRENGAPASRLRARRPQSSSR